MCFFMCCVFIHLHSNHINIGSKGKPDVPSKRKKSVTFSLNVGKCYINEIF